MKLEDAMVAMKKGGVNGSQVSDERAAERLELDKRTARRAAVLKDLEVELGFELPEPSKAGLATALRRVAKIDKEGVLVQQRDSYLMLAAWSIGMCVHLDELREKAKANGNGPGAMFSLD